MVAGRKDDPYQILGVSRDASEEELRSAYRSLVRQLHPDASGRPETAEAFRKVTEAYETVRERARGEGEPVPIRYGPAAGPRRRRASPTATRPAGAAEPLVVRRWHAEPLGDPRTATRRAASFASARGSLEDDLDRLLWLLGWYYRE